MFKTLKALINSFKIPDLRQRILFTLGMIVVYRLGCYITIPGINGEALAQFFANVANKQGGTLFDVMDLFTGRALSQMTVFALGIMPYISSSIIMQLLTVVIPHFERLAKEGGDHGRKMITQYTRYGTIGLALFQSFIISVYLEDPAHFMGLPIVEHGGLGFRLLTIITLTSGTAFIMWLGEQITERGIGNGMSIIITVGIISRLPTALRFVVQLLSPFSPEKRQIEPYTPVIMVGLLLAVIIFVVLITEGQRRIPVEYAKRIIGRKVYGGHSTYIPLRVNQAGVIPIIFAQSIILFPATIGQFIPSLQRFAESLMRGHLLYTIVYSLLIIFFAYFYTAVTFNTQDVAQNMKKYGGFIPGIRAGKPTAEYLDHVLTHITLPGAIFLAAIAVFPDWIMAWLKVPYIVASFFGGTGLLIIVGVMLDTMRQIESHLLMRHYDGFMKKGHLRGRR
ncbi:MAG: preprotein translocase subunit SecY [Candidatus Omnitrophica bacterium]|nr:preprotein translocase subunit SecY [Candidatus Omnitrophota bacterium]MBU1924842.1 preprotein translocase subunit SecY [Candidatus Omnitrophota bacterium]